MKKIATLLLLLNACAPVFNQSLTFTRTYGGDHYDDARSIAATSDGGFVFTGLNISNADADGSMYLTKVNAAGAVLWTQYYLRPEEDGGNHVLPTSDGGFLITGHTALSYGVDCDGFLVKTDARGNEQWRSFVGGALDDVCDAAVEQADGSFLVAGRTQEETSRTFRMLLAHVSPLGVVLFQKALYIGKPAVAYALAKAGDDALYLAGYTYSTTGERDNMLLVKCTTGGDILWSREWGSELHQRANAVVPTADGGCFVAGGANDEAERYIRMLARRYDRDGNVLASSDVLSNLGNGYLFGATPAASGQLAVAGVLRQGSEDHGRPCFALLDQDLNILNWQTVDLPWECRTRCVAPNPAGGFILAGNEYLEDGKADIFLATIRDQASAADAQDVVQSPNLLFPNPFQDVTYLKTGEPGQSKILTLTTPDGQQVRHVEFKENEYLLQRGDLQAGHYLLTVRSRSGGLLTSAKLIVK